KLLLSKEDEMIALTEIELPDEMDDEQKTELDDEDAEDDNDYLASDHFSPTDNEHLFEYDEEKIESLSEFFEKNEIDPYTSRHSEILQNLKKFQRFLLRMKKNNFYFVRNRSAPTC